MSSFYKLEIDCDNELSENLNVLLGNSNNPTAPGWSLIIEEDSHLYTEALLYFSELIESNQAELGKLGIQMSQISFWYMYAYTGQCNMEFWPEITKRIGSLGIVLCISCWER